MKFTCESCHAQYLISDEKVGAVGVRIRCKKCQTVIHVRRTEVEVPPAEDSTVVMTADRLAELGGIGATGPRVLPKVTEDEIGQAFDSMFAEKGEDATSRLDALAPSVKAHPLESDEGPQSEDEDLDLAETRVFTAGDIQRLASQFEESIGATLPAPVSEATKASNGTGYEPSKEEQAVEWFVAIHDEQVGPLTEDAVRGRWERGEIDQSTLVWRAGLVDWKALGSMEALARKVMPSPGVAVTDVRPMAVELDLRSAPSTGGGDAIEFKPSAASALASLASMAEEELAAQQRLAAASPPPSAVPGPPRGRVDRFADPRPVAVDVAPAPRSVELDEAEPTARVERPSTRQLSARRPAISASQRFRSLAMFGVGALALALLVGVASWAFVLRPSWLQEAQNRKLESELAQELARKAQLPPPAAPMAAPTQPAVTPVVPSPPAPSAPVAAAPAPAVVPPSAHPSARPARGEGGHQHHHHRERAEAAVASVPPPARASPSPGGDDFLGGAGDTSIDKEFAHDLDGAGEAAAGGHKSAGRHSVYIPPPPGQDSLPESLSQSDVMEVIVQHKSSFAQCVQEQKRRDPDSSGTVVMHWRIKPDGHPSEVRPNSGEFQGSPLASCLKAQVGRLRFGMYRGAPMAPIDFPFSF